MPLGEFVVAVPQHHVYIREETSCSCVDMSCVPIQHDWHLLRTSKETESQSRPAPSGGKGRAWSDASTSGGSARMPLQKLEV